jgi:hydroxylamine reductase
MEAEEEFESSTARLRRPTVTFPRRTAKKTALHHRPAGFPGCNMFRSTSAKRMTSPQSLNTQEMHHPPTELETGEIVGGFAHNQVLGLARCGRRGKIRRR